MLFDACRVLRDVCCLSVLCAVCCPLLVGCGVWFVVFILMCIFAVCCVVRVVCCV